MVTPTSTCCRVKLSILIKFYIFTIHCRYFSNSNSRFASLNVDKSPSGSLVNTLLKKLARTLALSLSHSVMLIFTLWFLYFSSAIPLLVFLLELAYCQNFLGLVLAFFAISFFILCFAFLTRLLTWFLTFLNSRYFLLSLVSI